MAETCAFWIERKRRNCKMQVRLGSVYCVEHLTAGSPSSSSQTSLHVDRRIPCPLDPEHSVYESKLAAHLKKCNARLPQVLPPYFRENCNILREADAEGRGEMEKSPVVVEAVVERIRSIAHRVLPKELLTRLRASGTEPVGEAEKHRLQQAALAARLLAAVEDWSPDVLVVLEFGAGKGGLSSYLWETRLRAMQAETLKEIDFILIDRSNSRCKKDAKMRHEGAQVDRIFIDIKDLDLEALLSKYRGRRVHFLGISKHLCGAATCLTINALLKWLKREGGDGVVEEYRVTLGVALCCHQCCSWLTYPNVSFLREIGLLTAADETDDLDGNLDSDLGPAIWERAVFDRLKAISSWAVCGRDFLSRRMTGKRAKLTPADGLDDLDDLNAEDLASDISDKEEMGRLTKRLFDYGRLRAMVDGGGFAADEVSLSHYIGEEVTLENALLFATKKLKK